MRTLRVLIVEQSGLVADGLRLVLEREADIEVVSLVEQGHTALDAVRTQRPDVVVMDAQLPGLDSVATTRCLHALYPQCHIVLLTTSGDAPAGVEGICAGATGVLLKNAAWPEFVEAVRVAARGEPVVDRAVLPTLVNAIRGIPVAPPFPPAAALLTAREHTVVQLVAAGLTNASIADRLTITVATVKRHLSTIFAKLEVSNRSEAVAAARGRKIL